MKLFIDSNIIIEALKQDGNEEAKDIWRILLNHLLYPKIKLYVNAIVYSESVYKLVIKGKKKSSDSDFSKPCEKEGILLINSSQQLSKLLKID